MQKERAMFKIDLEGSTRRSSFNKLDYSPLPIPNPKVRILGAEAPRNDLERPEDFCLKDDDMFGAVFVRNFCARPLGEQNHIADAQLMNIRPDSGDGGLDWSRMQGLLKDTRHQNAAAGFFDGRGYRKDHPRTKRLIRHSSNPVQCP